MIPPRRNAWLMRVIFVGLLGLLGGALFSDATAAAPSGSWTQVFPATSPPPRGAGGMAFDAARGNVVLFGGAVRTSGQSSNSSYGDTWTWDGTNWTQRSPAASPSPRN